MYQFFKGLKFESDTKRDYNYDYLCYFITEGENTTLTKTDIGECMALEIRCNKHGKRTQ